MNVDLDFNDISDDELDHEGEEEDLIEEIGLLFNNWTSVDSSSDRKPVMDKTFFSLHGLHPRYDEDIKDFTFFSSLMLPDELFQLLSNYTNTRADIEVNRLSKKWIPTTTDEMKKFVACLLVMGVIRMPRLDMYWSQAVNSNGVIFAVHSVPRSFANFDRSLRSPFIALLPGAVQFAVHLIKKARSLSSCSTAKEGNSGHVLIRLQLFYSYIFCIYNSAAALDLS